MSNNDYDLPATEWVNHLNRIHGRRLSMDCYAYDCDFGWHSLLLNPILREAFSRRSSNWGKPGIRSQAAEEGLRSTSQRERVHVVAAAPAARAMQDREERKRHSRSRKHRSPASRARDDRRGHRYRDRNRDARRRDREDRRRRTPTIPESSVDDVVSVSSHSLSPDRQGRRREYRAPPHAPLPPPSIEPTAVPPRTPGRAERSAADHSANNVLARTAQWSLRLGMQRTQRLTTTLQRTIPLQATLHLL